MCPVSFADAIRIISSSTGRDNVITWVRNGGVFVELLGSLQQRVTLSPFEAYTTLGLGHEVTTQAAIVKRHDKTANPRKILENVEATILIIG